MTTETPVSGLKAKVQFSYTVYYYKVLLAY